MPSLGISAQLFLPCMSYFTLNRHRLLHAGVVPQSAKHRKDAQHIGATMTTATQYAGLASLLALITATPSFAQKPNGNGEWLSLSLLPADDGRQFV